MASGRSTAERMPALSKYIKDVCGLSDPTNHWILSVLSSYMVSVGREKAPGPKMASFGLRYSSQKTLSAVAFTSSVTTLVSLTGIKRVSLKLSLNMMRRTCAQNWPPSGHRQTQLGCPTSLEPLMCTDKRAD